MFNKAAEKTTALVILIGAPLTTLFLTTGSVTDPVNATKLLIAGGFSFALISLILGFQARETLKHFKIYLIFSVLFLLAALNTLISSDAPLTQNLYGSYGRNTGFVAYLALTFAALGVLGLREKNNFKKLILGLQFAGVVNVLYCAWVIAFGDFLSWNNPYGNILGLFGNPNFISAFLGIFIATLLAFAADKKASWRYRGIALFVGLVAFYEIVDSSAIQGIVVTVGGIAIVGFFFVRAYVKSAIFSYLYVLLAAGVGITAILGALQKGPFSFVYKTSVSLRGAYWNAGAKMGLDHPFTGVGMDTYGDWYRRARSENAATVLPGPKVITNASHNVVLDFFAYGGWPLLVTYLGLLVIAGIAALKVIMRSRTYDPIFVAIFAAWVCYLTQSLISINQIGLAIWGWLLTGALVAYEYATREKSEVDSSTQTGKRNIRKGASSGVVSPQLVAGIGVVIGLFIAVPPLSADTKWRSALDSKDANKVLAALEPSYLTPSDSARFAQAVQLFASSNLMDQARQVALKAIEFNPNYFDAWKILYSLSNSTSDEKAKALENMKRLDPRNPDVLAP
jgi:O-antigen ligase